jgi:hypothetical protein
VDAVGLEPGLAREPPQDQKDPCPCERASVRVEEDLLPGAAFEERAAAREVAPQGVHGLAPDGDHTLLVSLADAADEPVLEVHGLPVERDRFAHAQTRAVEELGDRAVAESARCRADRRVEEPLDLGRRERARQRSAALR